MSNAHVFFLGATGYYGGAVLADLQRSFPSFSITALVRKESDVKAVQALGVKVVLGSYHDLDIVKAESAKADIVINAANSVDPDFVEAILGTLSHKASGTPLIPGGKPIFLHTSGGFSVAVDTKGSHVEGVSKEWSDTDEASIRSLPPKNYHVDIDNHIMRAGEEGKVSTYILRPPALYGRGDGPVVKSNKYFAPLVMSEALKRNRVVYGGEGTNRWTFAHISDSVRAHNHILRHALSAPDTTSPYQRYIFSKTGENWSLKDFLTSFAEILHRKGIIPDGTAHSIPVDELRVPYVWTTWTEMMRPDRLTELGWTAKEASVQESLEEEVEQYLRDVGGDPRSVPDIQAMFG